MNVITSFFIRTERTQHQCFTCPDIIGGCEVILKADVSVVLRIDRCCGIRWRLIVDRLFIDEDEPNVGTCKDSSLQRHHSKVLNGQTGLLYCTGLHVHHADAPVTIDSSAYPCPILNGYTESDASRKKRTEGSVAEIGEEVAVLKEELSPLWEKKFETVEVGHLTIDIDLRKVRIDGQVEVDR